MRYLSLASLAFGAVVLVGCAAAPAGTPIVIYVTPAPSPAAPTSRAPTTPLATAGITVAPTRAANPTYTAADQRVDDQIRDGFAQVSALIGDISNAPNITSMETAYIDLLSLAQDQQRLALVNPPSVCTKPALDEWLEAMTMVEALAQGWIDYRNGAAASFNSEAGFAAGQKVRSAVDILNASVCV